MTNTPFRAKGYWSAVNDDSKTGYHFICQKCNTRLPSGYKGVIRCKCDDDIAEIVIPSCKKASVGSCHGCGTPCCKENE
jgi:hypothetical protein